MIDDPRSNHSAACEEIPASYSAPTLNQPEKFPDTRSARWLAVLIVMIATIAAYHNSFHGPFVLDDLINAQFNPKLRELVSAMNPSDKSGLAGRPVASLSLAINHSLNGDNVEGYHVVNVAIHLAAALVLMAIVRRTLLLSGLTQRFGHAALPLATTIATLWAVHPVQTAAVTYISQRTESLMGLFYLLALYGFIRGAQAGVARGWWVVASIAAILGALSKEIIVTVPVLALLYDRTFLSASWREVWRRHRLGHLSIALCWLVIGWQLIAIDRGNVGLDRGVTAWNYALTSCRSIMLYLKLSFWPNPLILDYGTAIVRDPHEVWPQIAGVAALVGVTLVALRRRPQLGFAGMWFLVILAPVSSIVPVIGSPTAEHRVYLSLAAVTTLVVLVLYAALGRRSLMISAALACGCGWLTMKRNDDYRTDVGLWADTVAKCPMSARAHQNYGATLARTNIAAALAEYRLAAKLDPSYPEPHLALGRHFAKDPDREWEAIAEYRAALRIRPDFTGAYMNLANIYMTHPEQMPLAAAYYRIASRLSPQEAAIHYNLAYALIRMPEHRPEALEEFRTALRLDPTLTEIHLALASALGADPEKFQEAAAEFEIALRQKPNDPRIHYNYAVLLHRVDQRAKAIHQYEAALRLAPDFVAGHYNLGLLLAKDPGRKPEALAHFKEILLLDPANPGAKRMIEKLQTPLPAPATGQPIGAR